MAKKKASKKTAKKAAKKTSKKAARRSAGSSSFPTMEMDTGRDDVYSPSAGGYGSGSAAMTMDSAEESSSRRVAILGILVLLVVIVVAVVAREHLFSSKKGKTELVDAGKKESKMDAKAEAKKEAGKKEATMMPEGGKAEKGVRYYTVRKGDSLSGIAKRMLGNPTRYREIMKLNNLTDARQAKPGKQLKIPAK